jgi:kinesin family protein 4/21/27
MVLGTDKAFTFDYIFDDNIHQEEVYKNCVASLMDQFLMGYFF